MIRSKKTNRQMEKKIRETVKKLNKLRLKAQRKE